MKLYLYFLFLLTFTPLLFAESAEPAKCDLSKNVDSSSFIKIKDFYIKDFTRNLYVIQLQANDSEALKKNLNIQVDSRTNSSYVRESKFYVSINGITTTEIPRSFIYESDSYSIDYEIIPDRVLKEKGPLCISIYTSDSVKNGLVLSRFAYTEPDRLSEAGKQPLITEIHPGAGVIGDTLTIRGTNLGKEVDGIYIYVLAENKGATQSYMGRNSASEVPVYPYDDQEKCALFPFYLSPPAPAAEDSKQLIQELKFTIPNYIDNQCIENANFNLKEMILGKEIKIKLMSHARPATVETITLLNKRWKLFYAFFSLIVIIGFVGLLSIIFKKFNFSPEILLEPETNSYALANLQSLVWTLVLLGSYFYVALCQWTILVNQMVLPDFNAKLTALLGISFGGSVMSAFLQKSKDSIKIRKEKPEWRDIISDPNGGIDVSKLQLLGFTIICAIIYLLFLAKCNPLKGLPDIPETLHGLLGVSQLSYLATKAVDKKEKEAEKKEEPISQ